LLLEGCNAQKHRKFCYRKIDPTLFDHLLLTFAWSQVSSAAAAEED